MGCESAFCAWICVPAHDSLSTLERSHKKKHSRLNVTFFFERQIQHTHVFGSDLVVDVKYKLHR
jgi:hypothetical protein